LQALLGSRKQFDSPSAGRLGIEALGRLCYLLLPRSPPRVAGLTCHLVDNEWLRRAEGVDPALGSGGVGSCIAVGKGCNVGVAKAERASCRRAARSAIRRRRPAALCYNPSIAVLDLLFPKSITASIASFASPQDRRLGESSRGEPGKDEGLSAGGEASTGNAGAGHERRRCGRLHLSITRGTW
jgi:hypothetical protein